MSLGTPQTTIARPVEINGVGLFSGRPVSVKLIPADPDTGVTFIR
ncbi:MAG TPA: UDP-3-O-acyl-N-acetylglucosamine deacetylase, partial [Planctomycetota bacterium]|nr:UDP-3-O-acyl-N-acetylglucosamine deacetylase [Planctomycetota bacterium]